jgi:hypothetical protein
MDDEVEQITSELIAIPGLEDFEFLGDIDNNAVPANECARAASVAGRLFGALLRRDPQKAEGRRDILAFALANAEDDGTKKRLATALNEIDRYAVGYDLYEPHLDEETPASLMAAVEAGLTPGKLVGDYLSGSYARIRKSVTLGGEPAARKVLGLILRRHVSADVLDVLCRQSGYVRDRVALLWLANLIYAPEAVHGYLGAWVLAERSRLGAGPSNLLDYFHLSESLLPLLQRGRVDRAYDLANELSALGCGLSRSLREDFVKWATSNKLEPRLQRASTYHLAVTALYDGDREWAATAVAGVARRRDDDSWVTEQIRIACSRHPDLQALVDAARLAAPPPRYLSIALRQKPSWRVLDVNGEGVLDSDEDDIPAILGVDDSPSSLRKALAALPPADVAYGEAVPSRFHPSVGTSTCAVARDPVTGMGYYEQFLGGPGDTFSGTTDGPSARAIAETILSDSIPDEPESIRWKIKFTDTEKKTRMRCTRAALPRRAAMCCPGARRLREFVVATTLSEAWAAES